MRVARDPMQGSMSPDELVQESDASKCTTIRCYKCEKYLSLDAFYPSAQSSRLYRCISCSKRAMICRYKEDLKVHRLANNFRSLGSSGFGKVESLRILKAFGGRSAISGDTEGLTVKRWNYSDPVRIDNVVLLTRSEGRCHERGGGSNLYPVAFKEHVGRILSWLRDGGGNQQNNMGPWPDQLPPMRHANAKFKSVEADDWRRAVCLWWCNYIRAAPPQCVLAKPIGRVKAKTSKTKEDCLLIDK